MTLCIWQGYPKQNSYICAILNTRLRLKQARKYY